MSSDKKVKEKARLHLRNRNREPYDLTSLTTALPELQKHIVPNKRGLPSINFADASAVRLLNKALLYHYYGLEFWEFPEENLCPPIPGRADYIHHIADLLAESNGGEIPQGKAVFGLDIGVGASCIYPIIGAIEYGWQFIGTDINPQSIEVAQRVIAHNDSIKENISCVLQPNPKDVFYGVIRKEDFIDFSICNPPFHASVEEAQKGNLRKVKNLSSEKNAKPSLNFSGAYHELVCDGGEAKFIQNMVRESQKFATNCLWFSSLVSKQSSLKHIYKVLKKHEASQVRTIPMGTGNKSSRIIAWTFLSKEQRSVWAKERWGNNIVDTETTNL